MRRGSFKIDRIVPGDHPCDIGLYLEKENSTIQVHKMVVLIMLLTYGIE